MKVLRLRIEAEIPLPDDLVAMADTINEMNDRALSFVDRERAEQGNSSVDYSIKITTHRKPKVAPASATREPPADTRPVRFETLGDPGEVPEIMRRT